MSSAMSTIDLWASFLDHEKFHPGHLDPEDVMDLVRLCEALATDGAPESVLMLPGSPLEGLSSTRRWTWASTFQPYSQPEANGPLVGVCWTLGIVSRLLDSAARLEPPRRGKPSGVMLRPTSTTTSTMETDR